MNSQHNIETREQALTHPSHHARTVPEKLAAVFVPSGHRMTFRELDEGANRVAQLLRRSGIKSGDAVLFSADNTPAFLHLAWGCQRAGVIYTPVSTKVSADDLRYIAKDCVARAVFVSVHAEASAGLTSSNFAGIPCFALDGDISGFANFEQAVRSCSANIIDDAARGREMMYSSGTTGRPKGVRKPIPPIAFDDMDPRDISFGSKPGVNSSMVHLCTSPLYHAAPHRNVAATLACGGAVVILERFDALEALRAIQDFRVTHSVWVPTMFHRMLRLEPEVRETFDLSSHRIAIHGAAPCPIPVKEAMIEWWGPILYEYYAGTEGIGACAIDSVEWLAHKGSVGRATDGILHILDEHEEVVPAGTTGTVFFESGSTFYYWNDADKTRASRSKQGWWTYGDIGHLDKDGYLYLSDRRDFTIISGGVNVYPQEIEHVLLTDIRVLDAAVFGVPHTELGEVPHAVIHVADLPANPEAFAEELRQICRRQLGPIRVPRTLSFVLHFPRLPTGKLRKRSLRDTYLASTRVSPL